MTDIKIKHIFHSGFHLEYEDKIYMFDVFNYLEQYTDKEIYCFVSHSHSDHFSPDIERLTRRNKVTYIVSTDVELDIEENVHHVVVGDTLEIDGIKIKVFGSTDLGVSYYVDLKDYQIFHSGDLNWWHWDHQEVASQIAEKEAYQGIIKEIVGLPIDFAFVPVDYRLKVHSRLAMDYFIEQLKPNYLIPMHFGKEYDSIQHLMTNTETKLLKPEYPNAYIY